MKKLINCNNVIQISQENISQILPKLKKGKACSLDGISDQLFSLTKFVQIASIEIKMMEAENSS